MSKRSNRSLNNLDTNSELDEILSSSATRPSLGFLGLDERTPEKRTDERTEALPAAEPSIPPVRASVAVLPPNEEKPLTPPIEPREPSLRKKLADEEQASVPVAVSIPAPASLPPPGAPKKIVYKPTPLAEIVDEESPDSDLPEEPLPILPRGGKRLYHCSRAQDGHSHLEQEIYAILWKHGQPEPGTENRICAIGYSAISYLGRVHRRNIGIIINRLVKKLAIEILSLYEPKTQLTKTYRVFTYSEILKRRKAAGLEWIIRGRGVEFVDPDTREPLFTDKPSEPGAVIARGAITASDKEAITASGAIAVRASASRAVTSAPPPAVTAGQIGNTLRKNKEEIQEPKRTRKTTSSFPGFESIVREMNQLGFADEDAAMQLLSECQAIVPDVTAEEICIFIAEKSVAIRRTPAIQNPIGFLLATVPKCFVGEAFQQFRQAQRTRMEQQEKEAREAQARFEWNVARALELVTDEDTPAEDKAQIEAQFRTDPYQRLRDFLSEEDNRTAAELWSLVSRQLGRMVSRDVYDTWLRPLQGFKYSRGVLKVVAPTEQFAHVEEKYAAQIEKAIARVKDESEAYGELKVMRIYSGFDYRF